MQKKQLYILSGLGANESVFSKMDLNSFSPHFINWLLPLKNETMEHYASRLIVQINVEQPILLGLSFGGMMVVELAKQIKTEKLILLSSAITVHDIPFYYQCLGKLGAMRLFPSKIFTKPTSLANWFFGAESDDDRKMLAQQLVQTDPVFLNWAINQIICWKNKIYPDNLTHIQGSNDRILPNRPPNERAKYKHVTITGGGHFMVYNRADEVMMEIVNCLGEK